MRRRSLPTKPAASYDLDFYCNFVWRDDRLHNKLVLGLGFDPETDFKPAPEFLNAAEDTGIQVRAEPANEILLSRVLRCHAARVLFAAGRTWLGWARGPSHFMFAFNDPTVSTRL